MTSSDDRPDFVTGDALRLAIPAHPAALAAAGAAFLTQAFRAFGALAPANEVTGLAAIEPCPGGSTGAKLFLTLDYARPQAGLPRDLFVKFSRDFDDPVRDLQRGELESEVRLGQLSRHPGFPVAVPVACFADYNHASGTGLLVTGRVAYGEGGIEPHRAKTLDWRMPDAFGHYRAIVTALAKLAAAHRSGALGGEVERLFPFDRDAALAANPIAHDEARIGLLVARYAEFVARSPRLLPDRLRGPAFVAKLERDAIAVLRHERTIKRFLHDDPALIALCHWNANIDNAWFERDAHGRLSCGLIDWGHVRQMNMAYALWGCLSGAEAEVWARLDELLALFVDELAAGGGPRVDPQELKLHLALYMAIMGVGFFLGAPARILKRLPEAADANGLRDPLFLDHESARNQLHMLIAMLDFWRAADFGACVEAMLDRVGGASGAAHVAE
jgi:hypothetical protein